MTLIALPAFSDNYIWMLHDGRQALVVDPGDALPVHAALDARGLALTAILVTHHHPDHVAGIDGLRSRLQGPVFAPQLEEVPTPCVRVAGGQRIEAAGRTFEVLDVPGHTAGHIAYWTPQHESASDADAPILFCGDTLFSAGCGRLFEGTPAQMHASLQRLAALDGATRVCCAHEYTEANLRFALAVEPGNPAIAEHARTCRDWRAHGRPTLPSTVALERRINPFMRCDQPEVVAAARAQGAVSSDGAAVLAALRQWKNKFQ